MHQDLAMMGRDRRVANDDLVIITPTDAGHSLGQFTNTVVRLRAEEYKFGHSQSFHPPNIIPCPSPASHCRLLNRIGGPLGAKTPQQDKRHVIGLHPGWLADVQNSVRRSPAE